jgi:flavin-dependent thymidylate synthase
MNDDHDNAQTDKEMLERHAEIARFADVAMYVSEPMPQEAVAGPKVHLLSMTPDPLGVIAAGSMMYEGKVIRDLADVTDADRKHYLAQIKKTHLKAPWELVDFHFMIEGVTRSFTHQMVRQRTAVFMQESLRFAVKENLDAETPLPPSLIGLKDDDPKVKMWRRAINNAQDHYEALVGSGVPAEDARGLLPHQTTTRLHYKTNLRNLYEHAGNRLCTQAQFEWRAVGLQIVDAIATYDPYDSPHGAEWQQRELAGLFRPVCYLTGKCEFKASFDRACSIRERVDANHAAGRDSDEWDVHEITEMPDGSRRTLLPILPSEWLLDHAAARRG